MNHFLLHLGVALLWVFLSPQPSLTSFVIGLVVGFVLLLAGERLLPSSRYARRLLSFAAFVLAFLREMAVANVALIRAVLRRRPKDLTPGFITYDVTGLTRPEILILAHCITLTPGTTSVEISYSNCRLLLHALDASDPEALRRSVDTGLREPLLRWTR